MAVLSTIYLSGDLLGGLLGLGSFNRNDVSAIIAAAGRANMVRQFGTVTLRAVDQGSSFQSQMGASFTLSRFGVFSLG